MAPQAVAQKAIVDWLIDGARGAPLAHEMLTALCERLTAAGLPLWRAMVFVRTLHPEVVGRRFIWRPDTGTIITDGGFDLLERDAFRNSPMVYVSETGTALRRRVADADCPMDFPVLYDLRDEGVTDYIVSPLHFTDGEFHTASWATRQPGGFSDADIAFIDSIIAPLTRVAEIRAFYRVAGNLLTTYVGKNAGERVLAGRIRRGDTEDIHAAIWLSDMRGFTRLADRLPPQALVDLLNRYFDCQVPAIVEQGGEVLKFMGDGLLAIFPIGQGADDAAICAAALKRAPRDARTQVAALRAAGGDGADGTLWAGASSGRCALRQYRQRQSAGLYLHRTRGKFGGAHREARRPIGTHRPGIAGIRHILSGPSAADRQVRRRRLCREAGRVFGLGDEDLSDERKNDA